MVLSPARADGPLSSLLIYPSLKRFLFSGQLERSCARKGIGGNRKELNEEEY
jgi:hypothetical protein